MTPQHPVIDHRLNTTPRSTTSTPAALARAGINAVLGSVILLLTTVCAALVLGALFSSSAGAQPAESASAVLVEARATCTSAGLAAGRLDIEIANPNDEAIEVEVGVDNVVRTVSIDPAWTCAAHR